MPCLPGLAGVAKTMVETRQKSDVGARYRDPENPGKIHQNHIYNIVRSFEEALVVASA